MPPASGDADGAPALPRASADGFSGSRTSRPTTPSAPTSSAPPGSPGPALSSASLPPVVSPYAGPITNPKEATVKAAMSFVKRINAVAGGRKPAPLNVPQPSADADGTAGLPSISPGASSPGPETGPAANHPVVVETEVIEPAAPGSTVGPPLFDDALDLVVAPPALDRSTVTDYAAAAENWLMTDKMLVQYEEFVARGLLMVRNLVRSEPRYAVQGSTKWLPLVRDHMASKFSLIRAAAANAMAAFAVSTPGRDAIQKDALAIPCALQLLSQGIQAGCDNSDTQYSAMALANIAMNASCKQPLLRHGMLSRAADVLRAAAKWFEASSGSNNGAGAGGGGGGGGGVPGSAGSGGGRRSAAAILKAATYMATLLTCWAVDATSRQQLQQHHIPELASELYERCSASLGEDFPLTRRLALLVEACGAIELLEEIVEHGLLPGLAWELMDDDEAMQQQQQQQQLAQRQSAQGAMLRGVSFAGTMGKTTMSRTAAAIESLYRVTGEGMAGAPAGALSAHASMVHRNISRKMSVSGMAAGAAFPSVSSNGIAPIATSPSTTAASPGALGSGSPSSSAVHSPRDAPPVSRSQRAISIRSSHPGALAPINTQLPASPTQPSTTVGGPSLGHSHSHTQGQGQGHGHSQGQVIMHALGQTHCLSSPSSTQRHSHFADGAAGGTGSLTAAPPPPPASPGAGGGAGQPPHSQAGSMIGVHFSANIFHEAAAARFGAEEDASGFRLRSVSSIFAPLTHQQGKPVRLPAVGNKGSFDSGGALLSPPGVRSSGSSPMMPRHDGSHPHHGRLDLPFHLVRPIPTISASSGKVSRISAAYGQMASSRQPTGSGGSLTPQPSHLKAFASDF